MTYSEENLARDKRPFFCVGQRVTIISQQAFIPYQEKVYTIIEIYHRPYKARPRFHQAKLDGRGVFEVLDTYWLDLALDCCDCFPDKEFKPECLDCVLKRFP
jgi:hypothetical protein